MNRRFPYSPNSHKTKKTYSTCKIHHEMHDRDIKEGIQDPDTFWIRGVKN